MAELKKHLLKFLKVFTQHPACVTNVILIAAVTSMEQTFEELVFKCPEDLGINKLYAIVSFLCPAFVLWIFGILGSNFAWRLCQGLNSRNEERECKWFCPCFGNLLIILFRTSIIPLVWILIVLIDGDMYVCYFWNPYDEGWNKYNKSESQLIGWAYFGVCLLIGLIGVFCHRCCSDNTYFPHIYATERKRAERLQIEELLKASAEEDAKVSAGALMMARAEQDGGISTGFSKLSAADWESICREKPMDKQFLTPVQEFLGKRKDLVDKYKTAVAAAKKGAKPQENNQEPTTVPV